MVSFKKSLIYGFFIITFCFLTSAKEDKVQIQDENTEDDRFVATNEWQVVKEGRFFLNFLGV